MTVKLKLNFSRYKPAVPKCWLFTICGIMWAGVGLIMCITGTRWLMHTDVGRGMWLGAAGFIFAVLAVSLLFGKIAKKNIRRLRRLPAQGCLFAFQSWRSYFLIFTMILMGMGLRRSIISRDVLAIVYITIGGALFLSSIHYYRHLDRMIRVSRRQRKRK